MNTTTNVADDETEAEVSAKIEVHEESKQQELLVEKVAAAATTTTTKSKNIIANISRTITNNHPLMLSPTGTDSDGGEEFSIKKNAHINFPDLIPLSEKQQPTTTTKTSCIVSCVAVAVANANSSVACSTQQQQQQQPHNNKSPDLLSSESESADISPYHATVEANFQTVALLPKQNNHNNQHNNNYDKNLYRNNQNNMNNNNNNKHNHHNRQQQPRQQQQMHNNNNNINMQQRPIIINNTKKKLQQQQQQQQREDISSLDSISNHSFDNEPNLASLSPSSSIMDIDALNDNENHANVVVANAAAAAVDNDVDDYDDDDDDDDVVDVDDDLDDYDDDDVVDLIELPTTRTTITTLAANHLLHKKKSNNQMKITTTTTTITATGITTITTTNIPPHDADDDDNDDIHVVDDEQCNLNMLVTLPQYSAHEERRDVRNWQKITLPNGSTREIDMRVIEPYKRVLSHGGYLKAGGHNAIVLFSACHLPDRSRTDYNYVMDNLFLYVVKTLEQLVTEDYVLVYLHGGSDRRSVPPFPWLKKCYQLIDRRLRKSLKNLYLVHPTFWLKSIVWMARPFVSTKFWRKLIYVKSLEELGTHVAVEKAAIPDKVKNYDAKHC